MANSDNPESIIAADIGSVNTRVVLVDRVEGEFRFLATGASPTTAEPPFADISVGVRRALEQIENKTHRSLLTEDGQLIIPERPSGQGVDAFVAITSAAQPLRVAVVGLSREVSVASAARAVNGTYATTVATLALDETGGRWLSTPTTLPAKADHRGDLEPRPVGPPTDPAVIAAEALARARPEAIILVGGIDGGATTALYEIANLVATITAAYEEGKRPVVIFAGNRAARPEIAARIGKVAPLRMVDNVHPELDREDLGALGRELESLYVEQKSARLPGLGALAGWSEAPVIPSARAFENVVRFLSRRYDLNVVGADLGGTTTTVVTAHRDRFTRVVRADLGLGHTLENILAQIGVDDWMGWLPFECGADDLRARVATQAFHPSTIPATREDARLLQAAARAALIRAARASHMDTRGVDLIVLSGAICVQNADYGALALLALDAFEPRGVFTLAVDTLGLASAMGALAAVNREAAASVIERDGFLTLGTVIAPNSSNRDGQVDLRVQVRPADGGPINVEVEHGSLEVVPLAPGQKAALKAQVASGADLQAARQGVFQAEVEGGALGLIVDARGRPITLPTPLDKRRAKIQDWLWDVGG